VNKITDSKGNYLIVKYAKDTVTWGSYIPTTILYTGNTAAGLLPYSHVDFHPVTRTDAPIGYDGGSTISTPWLIDHIYTYTVVKGVDTMVKDYRLTYDVSTATKRARVTQLQECDGLDATAVCLQPTKLGWQNGIVGLTPAALILSNAFNSTNGWSNESLVPRQLIDVDGDGKADIVGFASNGVYVSLSTGTGFTPPVLWLSNAFNSTNGWSDENVVPRRLVDVNGDGKADIVGFASNGVYVSLSTGTGFTPPALWLSNAFNSTNGWSNENIVPRRLVDVDGDGRADIVGFASNGVYVSLSTGTGFTPPALWLSNAFNSTNGWNNENVVPRQFIDANGDGKADIVGFASNGVYVSLSTGTGFTLPALWLSNAFNSTNGWSNENLVPRRVVDVNGDGKADIVGFASNGVYVSLLTGTGFTPPVLWLSNAFNSTNGWNNENIVPRQLVDVDGDGKADIVGFASNGVYVSLSTGTGFNQPAFWLPNTFNSGTGWSNESLVPRRFADVNGDGKADIVGFASNGVYVSNLTQPAPDILSSITNGLGATTSISYKPLTDSTVYSKDSGAVYPLMDIQAPMYVVSSVSSSNGIGSTYISNYNYVGAKSHLTGGGFLGFGQTVNTDPQTGIVSTTNYRQDYPFQGLPLTAQKRTSTGVVLNNVSNSWASTVNAAWSAQYHAPQLTQSVESSYELTGGLISTVTTGTTYDAYGNPTVITVSTPDGYSKTTTNTYVNYTVNWYLGRLTNATVSSTKP
jgi:hypothetical protein